jgi:hypothetical protein
LPRLRRHGKDENEAYENAIEALSEWVRDAMEEGEAPQPRSIEALRRDDDVNATLAEGGIFLRVPLIIESGKPVKANISLDQGLLAEIDAAAKRSGLTRSAFLASAAREKIAAST